MDAVVERKQIVWNAEQFETTLERMWSGETTEEFAKYYGIALVGFMHEETIENVNPNILAQLIEECRRVYRLRWGQNEKRPAAPVETEAPRVEAPKERSEKGLPEDKLGTFTVEWSDGTYNTIRIKECGPDSKLAGKVIAEFLSGPDNTNSFTGFAFVNGDTVSVWNRFRGFEHLRKAEALAAILSGGKEENLDRREGYARRSGKCSRCGRVLTVPASLNRGMGKECADKVGL